MQSLGVGGFISRICATSCYEMTSFIDWQVRRILAFVLLVTQVKSDQAL